MYYCCFSPPDVNDRSDHQRLSDIFVQKGPYLKMYSTYIRQFDNNVALLDEQCRKNAAFAAVVKEFEVEQGKGLLSNIKFSTEKSWNLFLIFHYLVIIGRFFRHLTDL